MNLLMRRILPWAWLTAAMLGLVLWIVEPAYAQQRELEVTDDEAVASCLADPACRASVRQEKLQSNALHAEWEKKPLIEKLEPYAWIAIFVGGLWFFFGRKK